MFVLAASRKERLYYGRKEMNYLFLLLSLFVISASYMEARKNA